MKSRPILFSAPMVRTLLDGSKTQTRRIVKPKVAETINWFGGKDGGDDDRTLDELLGQRIEEKGVRVWCADYPEEGSELIHCPYRQPGDQLWVRETWLKTNPFSDGGLHTYGYRATDEIEFPDAIWKPSIHMPRAASRITLEITGVRVERLQDINTEDAKAEGAWGPDSSIVGKVASYFGIDILSVNPYLAYRMLWESINGPGSWDANPWVWVVEFKKLEATQ